ncbi:hypothetical protein GCM10008174_11280 [Methylopila turkensis]|uniref:Uncharacterized protein n=1 Tax=Methylopila turkensis TaxID=1437816 RepID=A0A9W6JLN6_9HYPH|nr:hypothetical protein GCM10008174_11280 [Methylopila turkensis]
MTVGQPPKEPKRHVVRCVAERHMEAGMLKNILKVLFMGWITKKFAQRGARRGTRYNH